MKPIQSAEEVLFTKISTLGLVEFRDFKHGSGVYAEVIEAMNTYAEQFKQEVQLPKNGNNSKSYRTFQGTPCVGQERIAFMSGYNQALSDIKAANNNVKFNPE